jgi:hypothetical protein
VYERSLNEAELILSTQKDSQAPVHKIWEEVKRRSKTGGFVVASLPDFSAMLEGDRRFQLLPAQIKSDEDLEVPIDSELDELEMERLGFYSEDQVKLRIARVVERSISEDDEEIGSIRRRAFVSKPVKIISSSSKKNGPSASQKISKKTAKKKTSLKKIKVVKKSKPAQRKISKPGTRGKK